jgi:hypothetical protein
VKIFLYLRLFILIPGECQVFFQFSVFSLGFWGAAGGPSSRQFHEIQRQYPELLGVGEKKVDQNRRTLVAAGFYYENS